MTTTKPVRLQRSRRPGANLQAESLATNGLPAVSVTRPGKWGNPYVAIRCWYHGPIERLGLGAFDAVTAADADREGARIAVAEFRCDALKRPAYVFAELRGRNLACWCKAPVYDTEGTIVRPGDPCHADVLLEIANAEDPAP